MCKVVIIPNAAKVSDLKKLVEVTHSELSTERDGFGWAAQTADLKLVGERTNDRANFKSELEGVTVFNPPFAVQTRNSFGNIAGLIAAQQPGPIAAELAGNFAPLHLMFHGRISTNNKALINVHPIVKGECAVIHNGVVTDHGPRYQMLTENDSEHVLERFMRGGIDEVSRELTGYYAAAVMSPSGVLTVFRDAIAKLSVAWIKELETMIYCTSADVLKNIARRMSWTVTEPVSVEDDRVIYHRPDGTYTWDKFKSRGKDSHSASLAHLSLGHEIDEHRQDWRSYQDRQTNYYEQWKASQAKHVQAVTAPKVDTLALEEAARKKARREFMTSPARRYTKEEKRKLSQFFQVIDEEQVIGIDRHSRVFTTDQVRSMSPEEIIMLDIFDGDLYLVDPSEPKARNFTAMDYGYSEQVKNRPVKATSATTAGAASTSAGL